MYSHDRSSYLLHQNMWTDRGNIGKSLTETQMWKLGTRLGSFISGNICFEFPVQCLAVRAPYPHLASPRLEAKPNLLIKRLERVMLKVSN
jgi:hypothetical protein